MSTGITYYSDCKSLSSITSPIVDNGVGMKYGGTFYKSVNNKTFSNPFFGLERTQYNNGFIYCDDASKLFSSYKGRVNISIQFSEDIVDGVYSTVKENDLEYILWGVNIGKQAIATPSIYVKLTKDGIKFTISTSLGQYSIVDNVTNVSSGEKVSLEFIWDSERTYKTVYDYTIGLSNDLLEDASGSMSSDSFDSFWATMAIKVNDVTTVIGNPPISTTDSISDLNFCILGTPYHKNNLECIIGDITIANTFIKEGDEEWYNSSSSSVINSRSSESSMSNSSFSYNISSNSSDSSNSSSSLKSQSSSSSSSSSNYGRIALFKFNETSGTQWYNAYDPRDYLIVRWADAFGGVYPTPLVSNANAPGRIRGGLLSTQYLSNGFYTWGEGPLNWTPKSTFAISFWFNVVDQQAVNIKTYAVYFSINNYISFAGGTGIVSNKLRIYNSENGNTIDCSTPVLPIDNWNFVVYNFNGIGNPITVYVNNSLQTLSGTSTPIVAYSTQSLLTVGTPSTNAQFLGAVWNRSIIDAMSFFDFALTEDQINNLWDNGIGTEDNFNI